MSEKRKRGLRRNRESFSFFSVRHTMYVKFIARRIRRKRGLLHFRETISFTHFPGARLQCDIKNPHAIKEESKE